MVPFFTVPGEAGALAHKRRGRGSFLQRGKNPAAMRPQDA